jgi:hypothetical protein
MQKINIEDRVIIYRDFFSQEDLDAIATMVKISEDYSGELYDPELASSVVYTNFRGSEPKIKNSFDIVNSWVPWYHFGVRTFFNENSEATINGKSNIDQIKLKNKIEDAFSESFKDYLSDWENQDWPKHVDSLYNLMKGEVEILRHNVVKDEEYSIGLHTDSNVLRYALPEVQSIITQILYLNDDYEGGELELISTLNNKLITYKPKAGDIVIMPSGFPYLHSAKAVTDGNHKIIIRLFHSYLSEGSDDYKANVLKYGEKLANEFENYAIKKIAEYGNVFARRIIRDIDQINSIHDRPFYVSKENDIYIDGTKDDN